MVFLLSTVKKQKRGFVGFAWGCVCSWVSVGRHGWSHSGARRRQHVHFVCLRQEWDRTQCSDQGEKNPLKSPAELSVGVNSKSCCPVTYILVFLWLFTLFSPLETEKQIENSDYIYNRYSRCSAYNNELPQLPTKLCTNTPIPWRLWTSVINIFCYQPGGLTPPFLFSFPHSGPGGLLLEGSWDEQGFWEAALGFFFRAFCWTSREKKIKTEIHCTQTCFIFLGMGLES